MIFQKTILKKNKNLYSKLKNKFYIRKKFFMNGRNKK